MLPVEKKPLFVPKLTDLIGALQNGLSSNFKYVTIEVVNCPDLSAKPFHLAGKGLNGNFKLIDIGGPPYLLPQPRKEKVYDLKEILNLVTNEKQITHNEYFIAGAGAGPFPYASQNCEGIFNVTFNRSGEVISQGTRISKVINELPFQEILPKTETRAALLANLFITDGKPGEVLKIVARERIGSYDFVTNIRSTLRTSYPNTSIGLGGVFLLKEGKVKQHVMPDFSQTLLHTEDDLNKWLKFYEMSAPLIAVGTLITDDLMDLDLRLQHFHSFSMRNEAGHYHFDTTPDTVEYLAYLNVASEIYRIDRPFDTHSIGRD